MGVQSRTRHRSDTQHKMKFAIFALFAAGALAQKLKQPLGKQQVNKIKNNAIKQAGIAQKKVINKLQAQAKAAGIEIDVQGTLNTIRANNEATVLGLVQDYSQKAQALQAEQQNKHAKKINDAKKQSFADVENLINAEAKKWIKKAPQASQKIFSDTLALANSQTHKAYKAAGVKKNQKVFNVGVNKLNSKVYPKVQGKVNEAQRKINAANKKW